MNETKGSLVDTTNSISIFDVKVMNASPKEHVCSKGIKLSDVPDNVSQKTEMMSYSFQRIFDFWFWVA